MPRRWVQVSGLLTPGAPMRSQDPAQGPCTRCPSYSLPWPHRSRYSNPGASALLPTPLDAVQPQTFAPACLPPPEEGKTLALLSFFLPRWGSRPQRGLPDPQ